MKWLEGKLSLRPSLCAIAVGIVEITRLFFLSRLPDGRLVQNIPDDAFYYMQAARNFVLLKHWTFDGLEPSSGFHLFWGYLLATLYWIAPDSSLHTIFVVGSLIQCASLALAAFLIARVAERLAGRTAWTGVLLVMLSAASLTQGTWLMESGLAIAAGAAILYLEIDGDIPRSYGLLVAGLILGMVATFCRSDSGILAFWLLIAHLYDWNRRRSDIFPVFLSASVLGGAVCGVFVTTLHTHWISGRWIQASAQQKFFWSGFTGWSFSPGLHIFYSFFNPLTNAYAPFTHSLWQSSVLRIVGPLVRILLIAGILFGIGAAIRIRPLLGSVAVATMLTVLSYNFFYGYDSAAVQGWYVGNYEAPTALLSGIGFTWFSQRYTKASLLVLIAMSIAGLVCSMQPPFPWQEAMWKAGTYLGSHTEKHPVGAWNAGIIGYFANNGVTNMDGLMNDSILTYAKSGNLQEYMFKRHITYIFESPQMWRPIMASRGGYGDGWLQRCIAKSEDPFPTDPDNFYGGDHIRIYTFDMNCLASGRSPF